VFTYFKNKKIAQHKFQNCTLDFFSWYIWGRFLVTTFNLERSLELWMKEWLFYPRINVNTERHWFTNNSVQFWAVPNGWAGDRLMMLKVNAIKFSCINQRMLQVYTLLYEYNHFYWFYWFKIFDFVFGAHLAQDKGSRIC
jgi:hypothetical protein